MARLPREDNVDSRDTPWVIPARHVDVMQPLVSKVRAAPTWKEQGYCSRVCLNQVKLCIRHLQLRLRTERSQKWLTSDVSLLWPLCSISDRTCSTMARLSGALDSDVHLACQRFIRDGVQAEVSDLYNALQKSNSALKRKPKKVLVQSIERVLDFMQPAGDHDSTDSEAQAEARQLQRDPSAADIMNRSLRANLSSGPQTAPASPLRDAELGDDAPVKRRRMANGEPIPKRQRQDRPSHDAPRDLSIADIGGMGPVIARMEHLVARPLLFPSKFQAMGVKVPKGILLHGPPGCGKTMISRACASEMALPFVEILGPSIVSGMSGESEKAIRDRFEEAKKLAPCLVFMDEIDAIAPKRESSQSQMEKRIVAQLLVCMDDLERDSQKPVMVLATTNRPDSVDPALRRGGRFDTEINIGVPNEKVREQILRAQTRHAPLAADVDFARLGKMTAGFVGADLHDFVSKAGSWQMSKYFEALHAQMVQPDGNHMELDDNNDHQADAESQSFIRLVARSRQPDLPEPPGHQNPQITMSAFLAVLPSITPSSKREGFATIPDVSWDDVGALRTVREELETAIVQPIKEPDLYKEMGITIPSGVLLWGPPGCGKTLLAKAVAAESKANFISIKGPELLNKFVGESEAAVRRVFARARSSVPCVIFFDELDALVPRRDGEGSEASARVVNTLLTELDGLNDREGIYIVGATNRVDMIDDAMMRPGRLETLLFVDLPGATERVEILTALLKGKPVVDVPGIQGIVRGEGCKGFSGADVGALVRQAAQVAIKRRSAEILPRDFEEATRSVRASVGDMRSYYRQKEKFARG